MLNKIALATQKFTGSMLGGFMAVLPVGNVLVCVAMLLFGAGFILTHIPPQA